MGKSGRHVKTCHQSSKTSSINAKYTSNLSNQITLDGMDAAALIEMAAMDTGINAPSLRATVTRALVGKNQNQNKQKKGEGKAKGDSKGKTADAQDSASTPFAPSTAWLAPPVFPSGPVEPVLMCQPASAASQVLQPFGKTRAEQEKEKAEA